MPLHKLEDFEPNYREVFGGEDVKALELYTEGGVRVGSVADALVDDNGRFRYLVIDTSWDSGNKKILLPIGLAHIHYAENRVYVDGLSKEQVTRLPEYRENLVVNEDYEKNVRNVYRSPNSQLANTQETSNYVAPELYELNAQDQQTFKLYEERLIANKNRVKAGEVSVGKRIETETAQVSVPLQKERVVIERVNPTSETVVDSQNVNFQEGEVARIEVYEETPEIRKETFVREEVRVTKVVDSNIVEAQETIRREELDIDASGNLDVNETNKSRDTAI
ncbi:DUF2382 domain-containing protein [Calothrix sp. FACHB-1219]|uniref:DUF2382 domain-containing protein n=1 Tax=unclassified Calothrix TaxID=2619626 RepID=UPI0016876C2A|nr:MULTISPECIES: DUF2382 domain-containing protein [unclassified Calothrix]MBD2203995.1 DUF2382 domain-containing protein [Calothrix sp. FACHB-168]MBD2218220.1 DUF2382 domain-containing protein [Calothrix sp. FACHB-1219]